MCELSVEDWAHTFTTVADEWKCMWKSYTWVFGKLNKWKSIQVRV